MTLAVCDDGPILSAALAVGAAFIVTGDDDPALAAGADVLVTGDGDLLVLEQYEGIRIVAVRTFLDELAE